MTDIEVLEREKQCVHRKTEINCSDCAHCDLLMDDAVILAAYDRAISALRAKQERENPKQITNADRIRAMSDEELAEFLCGVYDDDEEYGKVINGFIIPYYDQNSIKEWIQRTEEGGLKCKY